MTLRTKTIASACATLALGLAWAAAAQPALARYHFHISSVGEMITAPPGGTRAQTCADRLEAVSVYAQDINFDDSADPATYHVPADLWPRVKKQEAMDAVTYEVWKAPQGFHFGNVGKDIAVEDLNGGVYFEDPPGTHHQATLVARWTTRQLTPLQTPVPVDGKLNVGGVFVFTSAPISIPLHRVAPGDALGLRPKDRAKHGNIFVDVTAMDCSLPVLKGKVDVVPGSGDDTVHPDNVDELVPVRIFGSRRLHVDRITEVHLGEATPASVEPPEDVNQDGHPDRLYYFRQGNTDIMCIDTSVKVTGQTSDHKRFQASEPITTAGCPG